MDKTGTRRKKSWIVNVKRFLFGDVAGLSSKETKVNARIAPDYEVDEDGLLLYSLDLPRNPEIAKSRFVW